MLTRQEKERQVIDLYNQNKTYREIAREVRICPRDIGIILKKASGEEEEKQDGKQSPSSQAYKLFSEGKTPIEAAIALNLGESETTKYYEEYLNLKQMHELRMVYDEIGADVMHFLELYKLSKDAHMKPEHVVNLLQMSNEYLPLFEQKYRKLRREIDLLEFQKQKSIDLGNHVEVLTKVSEKYKKEIKNLQKGKNKTRDFDEQRSI
jgi:predicted transcriptional regulator